MSGLVCVRFYLDPARDAALLTWLEQQGNRSEAIRRALRVWVEGDPPIRDTPGFDAATLRAVLREELARIGAPGGIALADSGSGSEDDELRAALDDLVSTWDLEPEEQP